MTLLPENLKLNSFSEMHGDCIHCCKQPLDRQTDLQERKRLLSFVVVGGGPTGVEVAAELYDLVREEMGQYYPHICKDAKVRLVELQDHVLSTYDRKISEYTSKLFSRHVHCDNCDGISGVCCC